MKRPYPQVTEIWKFGRISDSETRFVALSGCLSSEVTPVKLQTLYVTHTEQSFTYRRTTSKFDRADRSEYLSTKVLLVHPI